MKIEAPESIRDIFSIFHDGGISTATLQGENLILQIEIQYLSERINPEYKGFEVYLYGLSNIEFSTWPSDLKSEPKKITDIESIFKSELEILEASLKNNIIEVVCTQNSSKYNYCGGELSFTVDTAEVRDESGKSYSLEDLNILCEDYWDEWGNKNN
jgi:hypothetical protein